MIKGKPLFQYQVKRELPLKPTIQNQQVMIIPDLFLVRGLADVPPPKKMDAKGKHVYMYILYIYIYKYINMYKMGSIVGFSLQYIQQF